MKKIMILFLFLLISAKADYKNITLTDFANIVSKHNNINILIDEDIKIKISLFIPEKITNKDLFNIFQNTVNKNKFNLKKIGDTYFLSKKLKFSVRDYIYNLKFNSSNDCKNILKGMSIPFTYIEDKNALIITSTKKRYQDIKSILDHVDIKQQQVMLKFIIYEFSDNIYQERGVQYASIYQGVDGTLKHALNAIVAPISTNSPILDGMDFYMALKLLNENNLINVRQNPFILSKNNQSFKFDAVQNIPYLITTTKTQAANTSEQNSIEYKDVGLKISGRSFIHKSYITLNIDLIIEDLLSEIGSENNMPETYKRSLKSNTNIEFGKVLLLSGLKKKKHVKNDWSIPWFSSIPWIGALFKYKHNTEKVINITIAIEVVKKEVSALY